ncbi:MAG TPA: ABC transporter permease [Chryseolinea sp.]
MKPPKRALQFLRWFCRKDYLEEIEGDLIEVFEKLSVISPRRAQWGFIWSVCKYLRPQFMRAFKFNVHQNARAMFRHNITITYRSFLKYKSSFFINLIGLSSGLACTILIYLWVSDELKVDNLHAAGDRLVEVMERQVDNGQITVQSGTPGILAETLAQELPEIVHATTVSWTDNYVLTVDDRNVQGTGVYAGKDYFKIFSFPLLQGDPSKMLTDKKSIVLSDEMAVRLFGTAENVLGKTVTWQHEKLFNISGVFKKMPAQSTQQYDFLLTTEEMKEAHPWTQQWTNNAPSTFVVLREGATVEAFSAKIVNFVKDHGGEKGTTVFATPYSRLYLHGRFVNGVEAGGRIEYVRMFSIIAFFILLIACINFMNLSTARASRRIKEIGTKKAMGASRRALIIQYLGESMLMALLSMACAFLLVILLLPQFNLITGKTLTVPTDYATLLSLAGLAVFAGWVAGSYPALYLSGFNPVAILKGQLHGSWSELWVRRGLVVFQFVCSVVLIVSVWVVYEQMQYTQTKNLGYNKDHLLYFEGQGNVTQNLETAIATVKNFPGVTNASSIGHSLMEFGAGSSTSSMQWEGKDPDLVVEMENVRVNYGMIEMLEVQLVAGRYYAPQYGTEDTNIIFNEAAIAAMGIQDPIGKTVTLWGKPRTIVGVVKNFHFRSFHEKVKPLFFNLAPDGTWMVMMKVEAGKESDVIARLEKFHKDYNPGFLLSYRFLDQDYQAQYVAEQRVATLSKYFAGLAILISSLGLLGLAAFTAERRLKEIGIRKIHGATNVGVVFLLMKDFTRMVLVAIVISFPISYIISRQWLDGFAYKINLQWWFFATAGLAALFVAWFTVALQTWRAARVSPAKTLRSE